MSNFNSNRFSDVYSDRNGIHIIKSAVNHVKNHLVAFLRERILQPFAIKWNFCNIFCTKSTLISQSVFS